MRSPISHAVIRREDVRRSTVTTPILLHHLDDLLNLEVDPLYEQRIFELAKTFFPQKLRQ